METSEKTTAKSFMGIVILIVIALVIILVFKIGPKHSNITGSTTGGDVWTDPNVNTAELCYIWNTEAGDKAQLSIDIRGDEVTGELNWLPTEKDKKTGTFKGTVTPVDKIAMARTVNAIWDVAAEGTNQKEELIIKFGEGTANVGFGEMVNSDHGVYIYAHPDKLSYEPNLSQTDCGDEAMN